MSDYPGRPVVLGKLPNHKPCPRCYAPMVKDPAAPDGWSCDTHGPPGSDGPVEAPPLPPVAANGAEGQTWTLDELGIGGDEKTGDPMSSNGEAADRRAELIAELQRRGREKGGAPSFNDDQSFSYRVVKEFGKWNAAIEAAGFTPRPAHGPKSTAEPVVVKVLTGQPPIVAEPEPGDLISEPPTSDIAEPRSDTSGPEAVDAVPEQASPAAHDPQPVEESQPPSPVAEREEHDGEPRAARERDFGMVCAELEEALCAALEAEELFWDRLREFEQHSTTDTIRNRFGPFAFEDSELKPEQILLEAFRKLREAKT